MLRFPPILLAALAALGPAQPGRSEPVLDRSVRQLVVAIAPDWNTHRGTLRRFERGARGDWRPVGDPAPALFGRHGLAWGRGVPGVAAPTGVPAKVERDGRAPAGLFRIGRVFGAAPEPPPGSEVEYLQVTERDAWVDDVSNPAYNQHVRLPPGMPAPEWFESQRMRLGDPAYRWLVEIRHNADPPEPGRGSAIFFHVRRGPDRPTAGCTTLAEETLEALVRWLRPDQHPHYVLLPADLYGQVWKHWGLPAPDRMAPAPEPERR